MQGTFHMCVTNLVLETNAFAQRGTSSLEVISNINIRPAVINVVDQRSILFKKDIVWGCGCM